MNLLIWLRTQILGNIIYGFNADFRYESMDLITTANIMWGYP